MKNIALNYLKSEEKIKIETLLKKVKIFFFYKEGDRLTYTKSDGTKTTTYQQIRSRVYRLPTKPED